MSDSDDIYPPRQNTATKANIQRVPFTTSNANTALAPNLQITGWVRLKAIGADVDFAFGTSNGTLVKDASGFGTTVGYTLQAGQSEDYKIAGDTLITTIGSGNGNLLISRAGKDRVKMP